MEEEMHGGGGGDSAQQAEVAPLVQNALNAASGSAPSACLDHLKAVGLAEALQSAAYPQACLGLGHPNEAFATFTRQVALGSFMMEVQAAPSLQLFSRTASPRASANDGASSPLSCSVDDISSQLDRLSRTFAG